MYMEVAIATSLTLRRLLDRGTALSLRYAQPRLGDCATVAPPSSCRRPQTPARPPPRFIPALWRVKNQLSGYSDLRQCPQNPHAASSYASVPTSPAALARVRRVAFILFGHRCDLRLSACIQPFLTGTENRGTKRIILIIRKANEN